MVRPTADDVRKANMFTLGSAHALYVENMRKSFGKEGLEALGEANRLHGLELGRAAVKEGGLRRGDPSSIVDFFQAAHPYFGFEISVEKATSSELEMKITSCPWIEAFRAKEAGPDICHWVCMMDFGIGQAVDADLKLSLPKCMMRGDDNCIYKYSKLQDELDGILL